MKINFVFIIVMGKAHTLSNVYITVSVYAIYIAHLCLVQEGRTLGFRIKDV